MERDVWVGDLTIVEDSHGLDAPPRRFARFAVGVRMSSVFWEARPCEVCGGVAKGFPTPKPGAVAMPSLEKMVPLRTSVAAVDGCCFWIFACVFFHSSKAAFWFCRVHSGDNAFSLATRASNL